MNIIAHKSNLYNNKNFIASVQNSKKIDGIMFDVTISKDKKVLIYSKVTTNKVTINTIQNNDLTELTYSDILSLDDALSMLMSFKGKIIINLYPLNEALLIEDYQKVVNDNLAYAKEVLNIVNKYPNLNICICTSSNNLLYQIIEMFKNYKKGILLNENSGSYVDVDFYIFLPSMLNKDIMLEQLSLNKEVMIIMEDCDDISTVIDFLEENKENIKKYQYITNHAKIFYHIANNI